MTDFKRGYKSVREKVHKGGKFTKSCYNCEYFFQAVGDKEEVCQNEDVLPFDLVYTETTIFCSRWLLSKRENSVKSLFKKDR